MHIYLAINNTKVHVQTAMRENPENMLISFHYFKDILLFEDLTDGWYPKNLIVDSGAFSVWTKKGHINIDSYIQYCKNVTIAVDEYNAKGHDTKVYFVNLDVLPGNFGVYPTKEQRQESAELGWANMEYMENAGIKVIHVFHQHEDFEWLRKLIKHQEYIGISPANDESQSSKNEWMAKCFSILCSNNSVHKAHGFAVTSVPTLLRFPFFSADSSSWVQGAKYASIPTFRDGKMQAVPYKDINELSRLSHRSEFEVSDMLESYHPRMSQGVRAYIDAEKFITEVWDKKGVHWNE